MRKIIGVVVGGFAVAGLLTLAPIPADAGAVSTITVTKTVVGPGPTGPYTIEVSCTLGTADPSSFELSDGGNQPVTIDQLPTTCTVTETATQGATVSYACVETDGGTCDSDQTVTFNESGSSAQVDITNTFAAPAPAPAPAPVEAQPAFTG